MSSPRVPQAAVDGQFVNRWSGRAFASDSIPQPVIDSLFEAARWAPSCFNEQPWLFVYAAAEADLARMRSLPVAKNRSWADRAPLLVLVLARTSFEKNGKPNRHAAFDAGAAWMSLALQAHAHGLMTHAMAGFDEAAAYSLCGVSPQRYTVLAMIAVGKSGDAANLPPDLAAIEHPNGRKDAGRVAVPLSGIAALLAAGGMP